MTQNITKIPRIVFAAPHSGSGKTTLTCGILAALKKRGTRVQAYKVGPDYIDPGYLAQASGLPAHNLDTWLLDEATMTRVFAQTASRADMAVVEGVMGLYDGGRGGVSSTAQISKLLKAPVVLVIDCKSMGESAAALALGFRNYDPTVNFCGVILNRLGSATHRTMIAEAMERNGIRVLGALVRDESVAMPERHLGLLPTEENDGHSFDHLTELVEETIDLDGIIEVANSAPALELPDSPASEMAMPLAKIGVARDQAFSFYYPESLAELQKSGAEFVFFSPMHDQHLPDVDGIILGGGFPEIFARELTANAAMREDMLNAIKSGMPVYAECGGYMYLTRSLTDFDGNVFPMVGAVPAVTSMTKRLQTVGYVQASALCDNCLGPAGTTVRGHEFHFSTSQPDAGTEDKCAWTFVKKRSGATYNAGYSTGSLIASYLHMHFAGNPELAKHFVAECAKFAARK